MDVHMILWWLIGLLCSIVTLPISYTLFKSLDGKGIFFSKILGLLLVGFFSWLIGFFAYSTVTIMLSFLLLTGLSVFCLTRNMSVIIEEIKKKWLLIVTAEAIFFIMFIILAWFRSFQPDISGAEKFMDFAFLNSILRAEQMPPADPWLAGADYSINYYYFGYLIMSVMIKMTGTTAGIGYNLAIALIGALASMGIAGVVYNLTRKKRFALLSIVVFLLLGNLGGFLQLFQLNGRGIDAFNWWTPSRIMEHQDYDVTINEFPFFSFLHADMHAHVMAIPFVILTIGLALSHLKDKVTSLMPLDTDKIIKHILTAVIVGAIWFLNSWDFISILFLFLLVFGFKNILEDKSTGAKLMDTAISFGSLAVLAVVMYLPFTMNFHSPTKGFGFSPMNTGIHDYFVIFGIMLFPIISFIVLRLSNWKFAWNARQQSKVQDGAAYCLNCSTPLREKSGFCGSCGEKAEEDSLSGRGADPKKTAPLFRYIMNVFHRPGEFNPGKFNTILAVFAGIAVGIFILKTIVDFSDGTPNIGLFSGLIFMILGLILLLILSNRDSKDNLFVYIILFSGFAICLGTEFIHIKDAFGGAYARMNTIFKFYYHVWLLFSIAATYGIYWVYRGYLRYKPFQANYVWYSVLFFLIFAGAVYPICGSLVKTGSFRNQAGLDGTSYLDIYYPGEAKAIRWINEEIKGTPVILEAPGESYRESSRVSSYTGLPTVIGWSGHEIQWRPEKGGEMAQRENDIKIIYTSTNLSETQELLNKYNIEYIYVGDNERKKYPDQLDMLEKFKVFTDLVYSNDEGVKIYRNRGEL